MYIHVSLSIYVHICIYIHMYLRKQPNMPNCKQIGIVRTQLALLDSQQMFASETTPVLKLKTKTHPFQTHDILRRIPRYRQTITYLYITYRYREKLTEHMRHSVIYRKHQLIFVSYTVLDQTSEFTRTKFPKCPFFKRYA